jgi:hypothetical protein
MRFGVALGLLMTLCGCISTHHIEYKRSASTTVDTSGSVSSAAEGHRDERNWLGPWPAQPDRLRP